VEREKEERNKIWKGKVKGTGRHREKTGNVRIRDRWKERRKREIRYGKGK
jgi:hypothetical protein